MQFSLKGIVILALTASSIPAAAQTSSDAGCMFEHARYAPVETEAGQGAASLDFSAADTSSGLSAVLTTPEGSRLDVQISVSNGYVRNFATMTSGATEITSLIQAFTANMERSPIAADNPAPEFLLLPEAGFEADFQQRESESPFTIPDGAWRFAGCSA